jgi:glutamate--cysteine ligase
MSGRWIRGWAPATAHTEAVAHALAALQAPDSLPSARVLQRMHAAHDDAFVAFARDQSLQTHERLLSLPWSAKQQARYEAMAAQSLADQRAIEAADTMPFEIYRQEYTSPARLGRPQLQAAALAA